MHPWPVGLPLSAAGATPAVDLHQIEEMDCPILGATGDLLIWGPNGVTKWAPKIGKLVFN